MPRLIQQSLITDLGLFGVFFSPLHHVFSLQCCRLTASKTPSPSKIHQYFQTRDRMKTRTPGVFHLCPTQLNLYGNLYGLLYLSPKELVRMLVTTQ